MCLSLTSYRQDEWAEQVHHDRGLFALPSLTSLSRARSPSEIPFFLQRNFYYSAVALIKLLNVVGEGTLDNESLGSDLVGDIASFGSGTTEGINPTSLLDFISQNDNFSDPLTVFGKTFSSSFCEFKHLSTCFFLSSGVDRQVDATSGCNDNSPF